SDLLKRGAEFSDLLVIPSRKRLEISKWKERGKWAPLIAFVTSRSFWSVTAPVWLALIGMSIAIFHATASPSLGLWTRLLLTAIGAIAATGLLVGLVFGIFLLVLRYHERRDIPDYRNPKSTDIRKIAEAENPAGYVQNHFMSVTALK